MRSVRNTSTLLLLACACGLAQGPEQPKLWAAPPNTNKGQQFRELFERPAAWAQARQRIFGLGYADHSLADFTDNDLRVWLPQIERWKLKLYLEVGAIKPWGTTGAIAFQKSHPNWDRFLADGAQIDSITMDEPLSFTLGELHKPQAYAVEQTAQYIALVRTNYPTWRIGDIEPYPSLSAAQTLSFIDALQARLRQMHVRPLDFVRLDVDYMNFVPGNKNGKDGWRGVHELEMQMRRRHLPVSMIYWAAAYPSLSKAGHATPMTWENGILRQGADYRQAGGHPDESVIESWVGAPPHSVPENAPGSFMHSVDAFAKAYLPQGR